MTMLPSLRGVAPMCMNEKSSGTSSVGCFSSWSKSMVDLRSRAGVPVVRRPMGKSRFSSVSASPTEGGSVSAESRRWRPAG